MTRFFTRTAFPILDVFSIGFLIEQLSLMAAVTVLVASAASLWLWAGESAGRLIGIDETD